MANQTSSLQLDIKLKPSCAIVIPAFNEETTLTAVVESALKSKVGTVCVVDDGSRDNTSQVARKAGARVIQLPENQGKGGALAQAALQLEVDVFVLIDADLLELTPKHIQEMAKPVLLGKADMTRGIFVSGRFATTLAQTIAPQLSGQRAIWRKHLLDMDALSSSRYGVEIIITNYAKKHQFTVEDVPLENLSQVMKEEKRGFWRGMSVRLEMYYDIARAYWQLWRKS